MRLRIPEDLRGMASGFLGVTDGGSVFGLAGFTVPGYDFPGPSASLSLLGSRVDRVFPGGLHPRCLWRVLTPTIFLWMGRVWVCRMGLQMVGRLLLL